MCELIQFKLYSFFLLLFFYTFDYWQRFKASLKLVLFISSSVGGESLCTELDSDKD